MRNCLIRAISPFPTMFSTQSDNCIPICPYFFFHLSFFAAEFEEPKIGISGKGLSEIIEGLFVSKCDCKFLVDHQNHCQNCGVLHCSSLKKKSFPE